MGRVKRNAMGKRVGTGLGRKLAGKKVEEEARDDEEWAGYREFLWDCGNIRGVGGRGGGGSS